MLFQVKDFAVHANAVIDALRLHDAGAKVSIDATTDQIEVSAQLTPCQIVAALQAAGIEASRLSDPRQIHVSGGSDCCGSCS